MKVKIIGAGLAGSEAAWYLASHGVQVELYEMRLKVETKAHKTGKCAELVCSNSLKSMEFTNAAGLLKEEMKLLGSLVMQAAEVSQVPAGHALAVDRHVFSDFIDEKIRNHELITFIQDEVQSLPKANLEEPVIIATGPLTSKTLAKELETLTGSENLAFFDAIAPIFFAESLNLETIFRMSRYSKGSDDYLNIPLSREEYTRFVEAIAAAEKYTGNEDVENELEEEPGYLKENIRPFEACMPIEDMIDRGFDTPRFGPLKPKGLINPRTDKEPYAAIQLRQDDKAAHTWSMVGMQTRMKRPDQERIFRALPGLTQAQFVRYGSFHRNTFIDSPKTLYPTLQSRLEPGYFFAGQITGTEGYIESASGGILAGINAHRLLCKQDLLTLPRETAMGALFDYISNPERKNFQPMNITYGVMPSYFEIKERDKKLRRQKASELALSTMKQLATNLTKTKIA